MAWRNGILDAVGGTPLMRMEAALPGRSFSLFAKWEASNPGGSIKDRAALGMLRDALHDRVIGPGSTIVESSSGNMGIALAMACAFLRLPFICVVDPKTTQQNLAILRTFGATVDMVTERDPETGEYLPARMRRVDEIVSSTPGAVWLNQYANASNARAHHQTMREIVESLGAAPDYLFVATSTCGTLRGCSEFVRDNSLHTRVVAVDAVGSVIFGSPRARRLLPGMGAACVPALYDAALSDTCVHVSDWACITGCHHLVRREAILAGGSSGGALAAIEFSKSWLAPDATCVVILCDRGERYLDTIYSHEWVMTHFGARPTDRFEEESCLTTF